MAEDIAKLKLENVRLSFPDIWEPKSVRGSDPKYAAHFFLDKEADAKQIEAVRAKIWAVAKAHWGDKAKAVCTGKKFEKCLHEGSEKEDLDGYTDDMMYLTASSPRRPLVIDRDRSPLTKEDGRPYGGCFVNAIVRFWVQDNNFGQRVNAELMGVQFYKDGEPFGGSVPASPDDFENLEGEKGKKAKKGKTEAPESEPEGGPDEDEIPF